ncbi:hypothetical protein HY449_00150 [Candidatus Pacearchaeota archaeon]|nr:hypothetical protein [Candidatus Pacearchaeota archaeon]
MGRRIVLGLVGLIILGCVPPVSRIKTERRIDEETGVGYVVEIEDRNRNGKVDRIKIYFVCGDENKKILVREKDYFSENARENGFYPNSRVPLHHSQKGFNTESDTNNPYGDCNILNGTKR